MPRTRHPAPPGHKFCHRCSDYKSVAAFALDNSKSDGLRARCRDCDNARLKDRYWTKERLKARQQRKAQAKRTALERQFGRHTLDLQERLKAEEDKARQAAELQERREAAANRFWARLRARSEGSSGEQS
jgi:hypothetical protein